MRAKGGRRVSFAPDDELETMHLFKTVSSQDIFDMVAMHVITKTHYQAYSDMQISNSISLMKATEAMHLSASTGQTLTNAISRLTTAG